MDREYPELLKKLHSIPIDYADGHGIAFEPFDEFFSESETSEWIQAWTGNDTLDGHVGPCEAVQFPDSASTKNHEFLNFAKKYAAPNQGSVIEIIERANSEFPDFVKNIDQLCQ